MRSRRRRRCAHPTRASSPQRTDLRDRAFVTIDPATARDHDDAVCVETARGGLPALGGDRGRLALGRAGLADRSRGAAARQQRVLPGSRDPDAARAPVGRHVLAAPGCRSARAGRGDGVRRARRARPHALLPRGDPQPRAPRPTSRLRPRSSTDDDIDRAKRRCCATSRASTRLLARAAPRRGLARLRAAERRRSRSTSAAIRSTCGPRRATRRTARSRRRCSPRTARWRSGSSSARSRRCTACTSRPRRPISSGSPPSSTALGLRRRRRRGRALGARARARARARGGQPRRALDPPARAAQHAARALQRAFDPALRARLRALSALHLADPALPRPRGAPRAQSRARGRSRPRSRARAPSRSRCAARSASAWRCSPSARWTRSRPACCCATTWASATRAP